MSSAEGAGGPGPDKGAAVGRLVWSALTAFQAVLIVFLTHTPEPPGPETLPPFSDKVVHFALYLGLAVFLTLALAGGRPRARPARLRAWAFLACALFAATDEATQGLVETRDPDVLDWLADAAGALLGAVMARVRGT